MTCSTDDIADQLYADEINWRVSTFWDEHHYWQLGDERGNGVLVEGWAPTLREAMTALAEAVCAHSKYEASAFARWYREASPPRTSLR
jgi:hypothetical protein